jgi:hypothetical protein
MIHSSNRNLIKKEKSLNLRANKALLEEIITQLEHERALREKDQQLIQLLLQKLQEVGIEPPSLMTENIEEKFEDTSPLLQDGSSKSLGQLLERRANLRSERSPMTIHYHNFGFWTMMSDSTIPTVASVAKRIIFGPGPQHRVDILHQTSGEQ